MTAPRRPILTLDDPLAERTNCRSASPYEGAAVRQMNVRVLVPLHARYARLVRDLADGGFHTTVTEILHALLHEGPSDTAAARELVRRWRVVRNEAEGGLGD